MARKLTLMTLVVIILILASLVRWAKTPQQQTTHRPAVAVQAKDVESRVVRDQNGDLCVIPGPQPSPGWDLSGYSSETDRRLEHAPDDR